MILLELMQALLAARAANYQPHSYRGAFEAVLQLQQGNKLSFALAHDLLRFAQDSQIDTMVVQDIQDLLRDHHGHDIALGA